MISGYDYDFDYDYGDMFTNLSFSQMENGGHYSTNGARQFPHKARYSIKRLTYPCHTLSCITSNSIVLCCSEGGTTHMSMFRRAMVWAGCRWGV